MEQEFPKTFYATKERVQSFTKFLIFDDRGTLWLSAGKLRFGGKKSSLEMGDVISVDLVSQRMNWVTYLIVNLIAIIFVGLNGTEFVQLLALLIVGNAAGILIGKSTKWILVRFRNRSGQLSEAYFADARIFGWGGLLGGTRELFEAIKENQRKTLKGSE